jgi:hypothetical protein
MKVVCPYCDREAEFVSGNRIYPHRPDLFVTYFWLCAPCDAYVGVHKRNPRMKFEGYEPLGRLANKSLRYAKQKAHAAFDPLWKSGKMSRTQAYQWLAGQLGISVANCHIGMFDEATCIAVVGHVANRRNQA